MATENCGGALFHTGHTCGDCQRMYIAQHANRRSWGVDPRAAEAIAEREAPGAVTPPPEGRAEQQG